MQYESLVLLVSYLVTGWGWGKAGQAQENWKETGLYGKKTTDRAREDLADRLSEGEEKARQGASSVLENLQQTFNKVLGRTEEKASDAHDTLKVELPPPHWVLILEWVSKPTWKWCFPPAQVVIPPYKTDFHLNICASGAAFQPA